MIRIARKLAGIGCGLLMLVSLTGCTSMMYNTGTTIEKMDLNRDELSEMNLEDFYSDETGFSFHGVKWGSTVEETEEALGYSLGSSTPLNSGTVFTYHPEEAAALILGRLCSSVELVYDYEGTLYSVTYQYMAGDDMDSEGLDAFAAELVEEFDRLYGENAANETLTELNTGTMTSVIYKWEEEIEGEQISSLQVAVSSMSDQTDMVIVGVICYDKSALEEEASE